MRPLFLLPLLLLSTRGVAQTQQSNQQAFDKLQLFINNQQADSIYELLTNDFKAKVGKPAITGLLQSGIYSLGGITEARVKSFKDGVSTYKVTYRKGVQQVRLGTKEGKISTLLFKPYREDSLKTYRVQTDNPCTTELQRIIDTTARQYIQQLHTVGLRIGVIKDGTLYNYGYGETAKGNGKLPSSRTLFEIGSITKTFTGTLLAYYANKGMLRLDDPITKYLPDSVVTNKELQGITLTMLSNHTSGLVSVPYNMYAAANSPNPYAEYGKKEMFSFLQNCRLHSRPGEKYEYSNLAVGLLGVILERVSGLSYEQMVQQVICKPLGMNSTVQHLSPVTAERMAKVYNEQGRQVIPWDLDAIAAAGCLRSTIQDMLLYAQANISPAGNDLGQAMSTAHKVTYIHKLVGLGWHISAPEHGSFYWHNGGTGGSRSFLGFNKEKKIAVVLLANSEIAVDDAGYDLLKLLN